MVELDHAIVFAPSLAEAPLDLAGFTVEPGRRHSGQGTCNRRLVFERNYIEIAWIEVAEEVRACGLDFEPRCAGAPGACPFGLVLRGPLPAAARERFTRYAQPDAPGASLWILRGPIGAPFVAWFETDDPAARRPIHRAEPGFLRHPSGATSIERVHVTAAAVPALDGLAPPGLTFTLGAPALELALGPVTIAIG